MSANGNGTALEMHGNGDIDAAKAAANGFAFRQNAVPFTPCQPVLRQPVKAGLGVGIQQRVVRRQPPPSQRLPEDICWDLKKKGYCPRGNKCPWSHGAPAAPPPPPAQPAPPAPPDAVEPVQAVQAIPPPPPPPASSPSGAEAAAKGGEGERANTPSTATPSGSAAPSPVGERCSQGVPPQQAQNGQLQLPRFTSVASTDVESPTTSPAPQAPPVVHRHDNDSEADTTVVTASPPSPTQKPMKEEPRTPPQSEDSTAKCYSVKQFLMVRMSLGDKEPVASGRTFEIESDRDFVGDLDYSLAPAAAPAPLALRLPNRSESNVSSTGRTPERSSLALTPSQPLTLGRKRESPVASNATSAVMTASGSPSDWRSSMGNGLPKLPTPGSSNRRAGAQRGSLANGRSPNGGGGSWREGDSLPEPSTDSWVKSQKQQQTEDSAVSRTINSILNKLTLETFSRLFYRLQDVGIQKPAHVHKLMELVFDKATTQGHFVQLYADLCVRLDSWLTEAKVCDEQNSFKRILLNQCQDSFHKYLEPPAAPSANTSEDEVLEAYLRYKQHMLGNIKFVGELLARRMLSSRIILQVTDILLDTNTDATIESLCAFLTVVAPEFDTKDWQRHEDFSRVFDKINKLSRSSIAARTRCLILDVLDARKRGWSRSRIANPPATTTSTDSEWTAVGVGRQKRIGSSEAPQARKTPPASHVAASNTVPLAPWATKKTEEKKSAEPPMSPPRAGKVMGVADAVTAVRACCKRALNLLAEVAKSSGGTEGEEEAVSAACEGVQDHWRSLQASCEASTSDGDKQSTCHEFAKFIGSVLELPEAARALGWRLVLQLLKAQVMSIKVLLDSGNEIMSLYEDLVVDLPLLPTMLKTEYLKVIAAQEYSAADSGIAAKLTAAVNAL